MSNVGDDKMIGNMVKNIVFKHFEKGEFVEGEKILRRLSFRLTNENTTEEHRLVLLNLSWVLHELGQMDSAKHYIKLLRTLIEKDYEYIENNSEKYYMVLGLYTELFSEHMSIEEKIEINQRKYDACWGKIDYLDQALVSKFDICELRNDCEGMVDCIESIHNCIMHKIYIGKTEEESNEIRAKLKETKKNMLNTLKLKNIDLYNELCEELLNLTNSSIAI